MSNWRDRGLGVLLMALSGLCSAAPPYPGIGRDATPGEIAAWNIDVRPDLQGLPKGKGSVAQGQVVWEAQCASCHGIFGESNQTFTPLVGGTTAEDVKTGRVARLNDPGFPGRTTLMKAPFVSSLWDYINRAMPWNAPKSLSTDEVYAVTAYLLNLGGVLPDDFVLSDQTFPEAQRRMPNRNGFTTAHGLWPGRPGLPDVRATRCLTNCETEPVVKSQLPDFARGNHGNLADQQRLVGPQRGLDTGRPGAASPARTASATPMELMRQHACSGCHTLTQKLVGPGFAQVAERYASRSDAVDYLAAKIRSGGQGTWGPIPMPAQTLNDADLRTLAAWIAAGAKER